jgi:hypothetical protein
LHWKSNFELAYCKSFVIYFIFFRLKAFRPLLHPKYRRVLLLYPAMRPPMSSRSRTQGLELQKRPTFFSLPRQPPSVISRDLGNRRGIERLPISRPMRVASHLGAPLVKSISISQPVVSTFPHTSAWTQVADHVVGRHPQGKPLNSRVATRAEISLISGHVHIPWAYTHTKKNQPVPVKVQKPAAVYAPLSIVPSLALEDLGNIQGLHIWRAVNNNAKLFKDKSLRHARENIPIAPRLAHSGRR